MLYYTGNKFKIEQFFCLANEMFFRIKVEEIFFTLS